MTAIYYFNTKEVVDNKFGTKNPVPFRVVDRNINLDIDVSLRCSGVYSYRISDPMLFYINVCGNVVDTYYRSELENQLKIEFISALQPAFATLSGMIICINLQFRILIFLCLFILFFLFLSFFNTVKQK